MKKLKWPKLSKSIEKKIRKWASDHKLNVLFFENIYTYHPTVTVRLETKFTNQTYKSHDFIFDISESKNKALLEHGLTMCAFKLLVTDLKL